MNQPFPETFIPRGASADHVQRVLDAARVHLTHHIGGGVYVKSVTFNPGDILVQHKHTHDHLSVLARGKVELLVDGVRSILDATEAPVVLTIAAGKHHGVKALTAGSWLCIHATDLTDPNLVDITLVDEASSESEAASMLEAMR